MAIDSSSVSSRRALLGAGVGAVAATIASALGRPLPTSAADGEAVVVGGEYTASSVTRINTGTTGATALTGQSTTGIGVYGRSSTHQGVRGLSVSDVGVHGTSTTGTGIEAVLTGAGSAALSASAAKPTTAAIAAYADQGLGMDITVRDGDGLQIIAPGYGISCEGGTVGVETWSNGVGVFGTGRDDGAGVVGMSLAGQTDLGGSGAGVSGFSGSGPGVSGETETGPAILGYSGQGAMPDKPAKVGVYGYADLDASSRGVIGQSPTGWGVTGIATNGRGVSGEATSGRGIVGYATTGTAIVAQSAVPLEGMAFRVIGRAKFDQCAGVATIPAGAISIAVSPGIDLVSTSAVVATLQGNAGAASTSVSRVYVNVTTNVFTIYLTAAATQGVKVAWHVFG